MTTEFVTVHPGLTADQTIQFLRETAPEGEPIFYVYVVDADEKLLGVFSLSELILAKPDSLVEDFMHTRIASVQPLDDQDQPVGEAFASVRTSTSPRAALSTIVRRSGSAMPGPSQNANGVPPWIPVAPLACA